MVVVTSLTQMVKGLAFKMTKYHFLHNLHIPHTPQKTLVFGYQMPIQSIACNNFYKTTL